jgi:hypothetical protein
MRPESQHRSQRPSFSSSSLCGSQSQSRPIPSAHISATYVDLTLSTKASVDCSRVQLVTELSITDGDRRKVGYYMGFIVRSPNPGPADLLRRLSLPLGVFTFYCRSSHRAAMEPSFRSHRSQARSHVEPCRHCCVHDSLRPLPFALGAHP